jgi:hypothetical protein
VAALEAGRVVDAGASAGRVVRETGAPEDTPNNDTQATKPVNITFFNLGLSGCI